MLTLLALSTLLAGQAAAHAAPAMPVIAGAVASPDCGGIGGTVSGGKPIQCVTAPLEQIGDMARGYVTEAERRGWTRVRADNNVVWLQKIGSATTCQRMTLIVFWDWTRNPEPVAGLPGYIGSIIEDDQTCEAVPSAPTPPTSPPATTGQ